MLGTFPKAFSQAATSQGYFPSGSFPNVQCPKRLLPKSVQTAALGPQHLYLSQRSVSIVACGLGASEEPLESYHMGNSHLESRLLWKMTLGKYLTTKQTNSGKIQLLLEKKIMPYSQFNDI